MLAILLNSLGLFLIIFLGYLMKRIGLLRKSDGTMISMIVINLTLPAAIIVNLRRLEVHGNLVFLVLMGIFLNLVMVVIGHFFAKKYRTQTQEFLMYSVSGYNIGNFAVPFFQNFFPQAIPLLSVFDIGNSVMLAGGSTVLAESLSGSNQKVPSVSLILRRLGKSVPFVCYVVMLGSRSFQLPIPSGLITIIQPIAHANTFLSMLMIGLFLELRLPRNDRRLVARILAVKYFWGVLFACFFAMLPLFFTLKIVLCLLSLGPMTTFGVINSVRAGMKEEVVGFTSSVSFLISLPLMTSVLLVVL